MDLHDFTNRLKVLRALDRDILIVAGLGYMLDDREWVYFREDPAKWLCAAEDADTASVWALVESRCKPANPLVDPSPLDGHLEPQAKKRGDDALLLSAAISLKRIADALTGKTDGSTASLFQFIAERMP